MVAIGARLKKEEDSCFVYDFSFIWNWKAVNTKSLFEIVNKLQQHKSKFCVVLYCLLIAMYLFCIILQNIDAFRLVKTLLRSVRMLVRR